VQQCYRGNEVDTANMSELHKECDDLKNDLVLGMETQQAHVCSLHRHELTRIQCIDIDTSITVFTLFEEVILRKRCSFKYSKSNTYK
jgi:hypothetical protein